jgi:hypothetical protein
MKSSLKQTIASVLLAAIWISFSDFLRNEILFKSDWTSHYQRLGLVFPSAPINGAIWVLWSALFAVAILFFARKYDLIQTFLLAWFVGFVLMWIVIGNLGVLPFRLLLFAVPLSLLETFVASWIIKRVTLC